MNEEIKYLKNTIKTFIDLKKKVWSANHVSSFLFSLEESFFFFFFFVYQLSQTTKQLSYFISKYVYTISCWLALKGRKIRIPGWMKVETDCVLCLKKKQQTFADKLVSKLYIWIGGRGTSFFSNHTRYIPDKSKYMLHLSFSPLTSTMELQNYHGPTSIVCKPLPSVR